MFQVDGPRLLLTSLFSGSKEEISVSNGDISKFDYLYIISLHERGASEVVFTDASSNMDEHNLKVSIICTYIVVGALPRGIIMTSDETTETLVAALFRDMLPENALFLGVLKARQSS